MSLKTVYKLVLNVNTHFRLEIIRPQFTYGDFIC